MTVQPQLIIHGGFISEASKDRSIKLAKQEALASIAEKSYQYLLNHTALETVVYAVTLLEDCELFNAGIGSQIQSDGKIRMSASLMDGISKKFSGVINIEDVKNPIQVAVELMQEDDRVLSGIGALNYARQKGFPFFDTSTDLRRLEYEQRLTSAGTGTVGCVALDAQGKLAAATSTGGKGFEIPCRVSDSATVAGNFADDFCGISCTGVGEDIVSGALAAKIATRVADGFTLEQACKKSFEELKQIDGFAGVIAIDHQGNMFHIDSHPYMVWASFSDKPEVFSIR